jgi:hypothetical protein
MALRYVYAVGAADVVEVRHGEWGKKPWMDTYQHWCPLCLATVRVSPQSVEYKYCPYCGAKMDGKGDTEKSLLYADIDEIIDATDGKGEGE